MFLVKYLQEKEAVMQEVVGFGICLTGVIGALWAVVKWEVAPKRTTSLQSWVAPIGVGGIVFICIGLSIAVMSESLSHEFEIIRWIVVGSLSTVITAFLVFWHFLIAREKV